MSMLRSGSFPGTGPRRFPRTDHKAGNAHGKSAIPTDGKSHSMLETQANKDFRVEI